ncbi:MAG TPA: acylphosphatase [Gemmatimonadales bacterium]
MVEPEGNARRWVVHGVVQGVGFRWFVRRQGHRLGLVGWARNLPDGSVEIVADGTGAALQALHEALRQGPNGARVDRVDQHQVPVELQIPKRFEIR